MDAHHFVYLSYVLRDFYATLGAVSAPFDTQRHNVRWNPPRDTPDWEDWDALYWRQPLADYPIYNGEQTTMPEDSLARDQGYAFGQALAEVMTLKPSPRYSQLLVLARQFAKWAGFRTIDDGSEFMSGFVDGVIATQPKMIEEKAE